MRRLEIDIHGTIKKVWAQRVGASVWYHVEGQTYVIPPLQKKRRGSGGSVSATPGTIMAPMPGKIIKVHTLKGVDVGIGDALVTMEAMKMEYCLKADIDGVVEALPVKEGDQVAISDLLVQVVPKGSS